MIGAEPLGRGVGGGRMNQMRYWGNSNTGKGRGIVKGEEMIGKRPAAGDAEREAGRSDGRGETGVAENCGISFLRCRCLKMGIPGKGQCMLPGGLTGQS